MPEPSVSNELSRRHPAPIKSKRPKSGRGVASQGDVIVFGVALSYLLLGILKSANQVTLDPPVIASFSLAGMCFVLSDLFKIGVRSKPLAVRWLCRFFYFAALLTSSLCLVVVPLSYMHIGWLGAMLVPISDMSTLSGMGVLIGIIVVNNLLLRRKPAAGGEATPVSEQADA